MPRPKIRKLSTEEKLALTVAALEFYANKENWKPSDAYHTHATITDADLKYYPGFQTSDLVGGKVAVEALQKISESEVLEKQS
jgi:hypothetical protein